MFLVLIRCSEKTVYVWWVKVESELELFLRVACALFSVWLHEHLRLFDFVLPGLMVGFK